MNFFGLLVVVATLFIIGLGFPLVIQTERLLGYLWWPYMLGAGIVLVAVSISVRDDGLCVIAAVVGATVVWGSTELKSQAVRAELGRFPVNQNKIQPPFAHIIKQWKAPCQ